MLQLYANAHVTAYIKYTLYTNVVSIYEYFTCKIREYILLLTYKC